MHVSTVILAAGQGTRMKSALPKVLHRVLGQTLIDRVVDRACALGSERVIVVVGHGREQVESSLKAHPQAASLEFVLQAERKGTGHAVMQARAALEGRPGWTLVLSGDVPNVPAATLEGLVEAAQASGLPLAFVSCEVPDPTGYGRVVRDAEGNVTRIVEHRDATDAQRAIAEINAGIYLIDNAFLWANLDNIGSDNAQNEYYITTLIDLAVADQGATAYVSQDAQALEGVNTRAELARAERLARTRLNDALMRQGVTMIDPATTYIDASAQVDPDALLEPGVRLTGATHVHSGAVIRQGSVIEDAVIETGAIIKPYCHIEGARVREGSQVGPFAHIRPGSDLGPNAKVGNFVETKKTRLGAGSKASHLTYLGDAQVGEGVNIGAGTITCNYDGRNKHTTTIDDGAFIGSNTALVAPVRIGRDAYVGAGSTLTKEVPDGALGVARGRQKNIDGWGARKKKRST